MTIARKKIISSDYDYTYHCTSRCVRRGYLCGCDPYNGRNYDHRKKWIYDRLKKLSGIFTIDILCYAIMSNHTHVLLKTNYQKTQALSDEEVIVRWYTLYPKSINNGNPPDENLIKILLQDKQKISCHRERLGSVSYFMAALNEYIARLANLEEDCTGRFWQGRFSCQRVEDEGAILQNALYIDLNPIRANVATTPEKSKYTSAYDRIKSKQAREFLESKKERLSKEEKGKLLKQAQQDAWLTSIFNTKDSTGLINMSFEEYLELLDWTGRCLHEGKRGTIPSHLSDILKRLSVKTNDFGSRMNHFRKDFHYLIANPKRMKEFARKLGKKWLHGVSNSKKYFC